MNQIDKPLWWFCVMTETSQATREVAYIELESRRETFPQHVKDARTAAKYFVGRFRSLDKPGLSQADLSRLIYEDLSATQNAGFKVFTALIPAHVDMWTKNWDAYRRTM